MSLDEKRGDDWTPTISPVSDSSEKVMWVDDVDIEFPEGGKGWWVVLGSTFLMFSTFGLVTTWGVFQEYYENNLLQNYSPSTISFIGSVQYSLVFVPSLLSGRLFDRGHLRVPLLLASTLLAVSVLLIGECKTYWQLMLTQGICVGIACGFCFGPAFIVLSHWFNHRRATAYGIVCTGSSVGGTVIPIAVRNLLPIIGFRWTLRILALILFVALGVANLLVRQRLPPKQTSGGLFNISAFKSAPYAVYVLAVFTAFLGLFTMLTYVVDSSHSPPSTSFYLVSIVNGSSFIGRLSSGFLGDRYGPMNTLIPFCFLTGVSSVIWPFVAGNETALIGVALFYGIAQGGTVTLIPSPISHLGSRKVEDIGRRTGMMFTIASIGSLIGPPISGVIHDKEQGFEVVGVWAGSIIILSCVLMGLARWKALGGLFGRF